MPSSKITLMEDPSKSISADTSVVNNEFVFSGPALMDVLELALLASQAVPDSQGPQITQSLASHIRDTIDSGLGLRRSAIFEAQSRKRTENRKLAAATAEKLQDLRASIGQAAHDQGILLEEETKRLVKKIRETERTAAQDTNRLKSLEDKLRQVDPGSSSFAPDTNADDIRAVEQLIADFQNEKGIKRKRANSEEV